MTACRDCGAANAAAKAHETGFHRIIRRNGIVAVVRFHCLELTVQFTRILAIRHGETAWNRDTRIQGHTDIGLSDHGRWQVDRLAQALREEPIAAFYASDLSRARETAEAVARRHGARVQTHAGLRERSFGRFEGQTWAELESRYPAESMAWRKRVPDFAPPGGESLLQLRERVVSTVEQLAARHPGEQVLLVAHGGVLDILYRAATRLELQAPRSWELPNTAINRLLWSPEGMSLVGWADTGHLQACGGNTILDERSA
ncbi:MAG: histidine phosphatase family protein [Burkholderiales bacterium]|nr:MAG: histidine phosphatase family protein [Burkholderiales bacterium]